jgi:hypothetical protein
MRGLTKINMCSGPQPAIIWWGAAAGISLLTGAAIAKAPTAAWIIAGLAGAFAVIETPPAFLIVCGVAAAALSRVGVALGLPSFLNFLHFPFVLGGAILASMAAGGKANATARMIARGMLSLLLVFLLSWATNSGEILRPLFDWLVFMEPFLLIYAILKAPPSARFASRYWILIGLLSALQFPFGVWQFLTLGWSDVVQGTFIGQGTGAHVAGGVCLLGVLMAIGSAVYETSFIKKVTLLAASALLFSIPVVADAKQAILAFVPAAFMALVRGSKIRVTQLIVAITVAGCLFAAAFMIYQPLRVVLNDKLISQGAEGKATGIVTVLSFMGRAPVGWVLGIGPGNSVSRVALLTSGGDVSSESPIASLGLKVAPTTDELRRATQADYISSSSSAFTTTASWLGLLGDCGPIAVCLYVWLGWTTWCAIGRSGWRPIAAKGAILMAALLGGIYSWLEEPGFMLMVGSIVSLAIVDNLRRLGQQS